MSDRPTGPLGVDPLHYVCVVFGLLICWVGYLLLPKGMRQQHFGAYPKRFRWSARPRSKRGSVDGSGSGGIAGRGQAPGGTSQNNYRNLSSQGIGGGGAAYGAQQYQPPTGGNGGGYGGQQQQMGSGAGQQNDEVVVSAAMQQLREPGVLIVAHGSRGKPKTVRLQLTESAVTWRTETRKKSSGEPKVGKLHQVPLTHIMYVDVGKQTTALRRVENSAVPEALCFSLLTKEGSLDLEANSPRERDALVSCFSLVLDEVHAQNWRDIYRGSHEMPSSFDEMDGPANQV